ncbi:PPE domain-containing protein [Nocardia stercoris]|nr:PPE domain-containing protein [Nocardia stercoris]
MNVDPGELAALASALSDLVHATHGGLPGGWVHPAGAEPHSAFAATAHNARGAELLNQMIDAFNGLHPNAYDIGASASDYSAADDEGGRTIAGGGGPILVNPVSMVPQFPARQAPAHPVAEISPDPLVFAEQLHSGPGTGPARAYAQSLRQFLAGPHADALDGLDSTIQGLQSWTPVGDLAAANIVQHRNRLAAAGQDLGDLATSVDGYADAYNQARAKHPTPQEIQAARKKLLAAMRSKNPAAIAAAMKEFEEINARSLQTVGDYTTTVTDNTKKPVKTDPTDPTDPTTGKPTKQNGSTGDSSMAQMLPALMSMMNQNSLAGQNQTGLQDPNFTDGQYPDYGLPSIPSVVGGGDPTGGLPEMPSVETPTVTVGALPADGSIAAATAASQLPRTPVIEPLSSPSLAAAAGRAGAPGGGMPYMPMMPGAHGAGAGGGGERNRVVAWHPDRLMYVDDTPYTEAVIGEKPTIAPTVTPPTPAPPQPPSNTGGAV